MNGFVLINDIIAYCAIQSGILGRNYYLRRSYRLVENPLSNFRQQKWRRSLIKTTVLEDKIVPINKWIILLVILNTKYFITDVFPPRKKSHVHIWLYLIKWCLGGDLASSPLSVWGGVQTPWTPPVNPPLVMYSSIM